MYAGIDAIPKPVLDDLTVVIPTLGRAILKDCLQSIAAGNVWPAHLIVIDQGSSPEVAYWMELLRSGGMHAEHVPSSQRGRASAVNRGLE